MAKKIAPHPQQKAERFEGLQLFGRAGRGVFEIHEHPISDFLLFATATVNGHEPLLIGLRYKTKRSKALPAH